MLIIISLADNCILTKMKYFYSIHVNYCNYVVILLHRYIINVVLIDTSMLHTSHPYAIITYMHQHCCIYVSILLYLCNNITTHLCVMSYIYTIVSLTVSLVKYSSWQSWFQWWILWPKPAKQSNKIPHNAMQGTLFLWPHEKRLKESRWWVVMENGRRCKSDGCSEV